MVRTEVAACRETLLRTDGMTPSRRRYDSKPGRLFLRCVHPPYPHLSPLKSSPDLSATCLGHLSLGSTPPPASRTIKLNSVVDRRRTTSPLTSASETYGGVDNEHDVLQWLVMTPCGMSAHIRIAVVQSLGGSFYGTQTLSKDFLPISIASIQPSVHHHHSF